MMKLKKKLTCAHSLRAGCVVSVLPDCLMYLIIWHLSGPVDARVKEFSVDKKNQLDVTFCILYFSSNSCSTCFRQPCAHHQELTIA